MRYFAWAIFFAALSSAAEVACDEFCDAAAVPYCGSMQRSKAYCPGPSNPACIQCKKNLAVSPPSAKFVLRARVPPPELLGDRISKDGTCYLAPRVASARYRCPDGQTCIKGNRPGRPTDMPGVCAHQVVCKTDQDCKNVSPAKCQLDPEPNGNPLPEGLKKGDGLCIPHHE